MFEIILKIDAGNGVIVQSDGIQNHQNRDVIQAVHQAEQELRDIQTFLLDGVQYFKAGEIYWVIAVNETINKIGRSKYYNNRKRSDYVVQ